MKATQVKLSNRPYRVDGEYPNITVIFDCEVKPLRGVMYALGLQSQRELRKSEKHGYGLGISSVWEDPKETEGPAYLSVTLPIVPGHVEKLQTYIDEARKIAEVAVPLGLNMKVALDAEKKRMGDAITVELDASNFRYRLKGSKHYARPYEVLVNIDEEGHVTAYSPRDPEKVRKALQEVEDEAEAKEAERNKYTADQRAEIRRQEDIKEKKVAAETRVAVEKLRAEATLFKGEA